MKNIITTISIAMIAVFAVAAIGPLCAAPKELTDKQVVISNKLVIRDGKKVNVSLRIAAGKKAVANGETLIFKPILSDGFHKWEMPVVVVRGKKAGHIVERHKRAGGKDPLKSAVDSEAIVLRDKGAFVDYRATLDYQPWMRGSNFMAEAVTVGGAAYSRFDDELLLAGVLPEAVVEEAPAPEPKPEPQVVDRVCRDSGARRGGGGLHRRAWQPLADWERDGGALLMLRRLAA